LPHLQGARWSDCAKCHPGTVDENGHINVAGGLHIDGKIDTVTECYTCHGKEKVNAAPPLSLSGSEDTKQIGVGAHQAHMQEGKVAKAIQCQECHVVPKNVDDPGHLPEGPDDTHAKVVFGTLAKNANLTPAWNRETAQCADTYCHGASLTGGTKVGPTWTLVDGSWAACDSCHGNPPPLPHLQGARWSDCAKCHPGTVDENGHINVAGGLHIDGKIDTVTECYTCHGKEKVNAAPPLSLSGSEDTHNIGVGAHQTHMQEGKVAKAIQCQECHIVPKNVDDPGHLPEGPDDTHAKVVFGTLAKNANLTPAWNRETAQCANTYCHGASLTGGTKVGPTWTLVDGSWAKCDSCHGFPPPSPHYQDGACEMCHPRTVTSGQTINTSSGTHIDGETTFF
jgi:predicted CxxxxCH...CXXCH cytochrome family protein